MINSHFCVICNSSFCNHALQINEHNTRMEQARAAAGMRMEYERLAPGLHMGLGTAIGVTTSHNFLAFQGRVPEKNKKLLLLRRGK